jgi:hypothetical protein
MEDLTSYIRHAFVGVITNKRRWSIMKIWYVVFLNYEIAVLVGDNTNKGEKSKDERGTIMF